MSNILNQQQQDLQLQLQELIKVGVGGKFKDTTDYTAKIQEELRKIASFVLRIMRKVMRCVCFPLASTHIILNVLIAGHLPKKVKPSVRCATHPYVNLLFFL